MPPNGRAAPPCRDTEACGAGRRLPGMADPDEPPAGDELPLPPRPAAEVLVPPLPAAELRREWQRLEAERESAQHALGGQVVEMAGEGALSPALLADGAAAVRSRQDQMDAITAALGGKAPGRPPASRVAARDDAGRADRGRDRWSRGRRLHRAAARRRQRGARHGLQRRHADARGAAAADGHRHRPRASPARVRAVAERARGGHAVARRQ